MEKKKTIWIAVAAIVIAAVMGTIFLTTKPAVNTGKKHAVLEVKDDKGEIKTYTADTNAAYLVDLMDELQNSSDFSYDAQNGDYGLFIQTVNGKTADYSIDHSYWAVYVNGQYGSYGISEQPVADGDTYLLAYEK